MTDGQQPPAFEDHFSRQAEDYARFRPRYPEALFTELARLAPAQERAWDCATGSGQAAVALAEYFDEVVAIEPSASQLEHAAPHPKVIYRQATAEASGLDKASVDLVVAAAAAHWFDLDDFYAEIRRVCRPGAVVALFSYFTAVEVHPDVDALIARWSNDVLHEHWPERIERVRQRYAAIPFPFQEQPFGEHACTARWTKQAVVGVFSTWSATQRAVAEAGESVIARFGAELEEVWPAGADELDVKVPLFGRLGRVG